MKEATTPWWVRALSGLVFLNVAVWFLLSLISSMGVSCPGEPCQSRADTGWLVLMGLQVGAGAATILLWRRPGLRYLGLAVGAALPPGIFFIVTGVFYPSSFSL